MREAAHLLRDPYADSAVDPVGDAVWLSQGHIGAYGDDLVAALKRDGRLLVDGDASVAAEGRFEKGPEICVVGKATTEWTSISWSGV